MSEQIKNRKEKSQGILGKIAFVVLIIIILLVTSFFAIRMIGKKQLSTPVLEDIHPVDIGTEEVGLEENQIIYGDNVYQLNEDMITILVMGIDKETVTTIGGQSWTEEESSEYAGGQADALFLVLMNPHDKTVKVVSINRNAMADVDVWDAEGNYKGVFVKQIALQHGYGDGKEESCERQVHAVSRMLHNMPIHAYVAISMDAIPELNDALGGITVEVLDDIVYPEYNMDLHQGDIVKLEGETAYWYLRLRNENVFNSNELRLQRQKQYLTNFALEAKNQAMSDFGIAIDLYNTVGKYMTTDIDISSFTYLATEAIGYQFNIDHIYSLPGEVVQGNYFEEFYVDDTALQELLLTLFYEPVEENK